MRRVVVVGAGFAGLAAAVDLAGRGIGVDVLEGRRHLGGRAYAFRHAPTGDTVDNGQHLFMRCYRATQGFLRTIGTAERLRFQDGFRVDFSRPGQAPFALTFPRRGPRGLRTLAGFLRFPPFRLSDLGSLRRAARSLDDAAWHGATAAEWLAATGASASFRESFWDPLCIAALNRRPAEAAADDLRAVVRQAFFGSPGDADLGHPGTGLTALYTEAARDFVQARHGTVRTGTRVDRVDRVDRDGPVAFRLVLRGGDTIRADAVICAVPPPALLRLLPEGPGTLREVVSGYRASPIVSVNLWLDRPVLTVPVLGLLGTRFQWAFWKARLYEDRDRAAAGHVALVASAADALVALSDDATSEVALADLRAHCPAAREASCLHRLVVRERRATYDLPPGCGRPGNRTAWRGLFVAGDWTDTGLPATVESAVVSGQRAAHLATDHLART